MPSINGYQYITEQEAKNAVALCNSYYGIPKSPDDETQTWVNYQFADLNTPQFWYIMYNDSLLPVLGQPTEFEVITAPFPPVV
jgi:hypothetical protein